MQYCSGKGKGNVGAPLPCFHKKKNQAHGQGGKSGRTDSQIFILYLFPEHRCHKVQPKCYSGVPVQPIWVSHKEKKYILTCPWKSTKQILLTKV